MTRRKKNLINKIVIVLIVLLSFTTYVSADRSNVVPDVDTTRKDVFTIKFNYHKSKDSSEPISGATFEIFKVADLSTKWGSAKYTPNEKFKGIKTAYNNLDTEKSMKLAKVLSSYADKNKYIGKKVMTGRDGIARFTGLSHGIYLVKQVGQRGNAKAFVPVEPYLVLVPGIDRDNGPNQWIYEVTSEPKPTLTRKNPKSVSLNLEYKKILRGKKLKDKMFRFKLQETDSYWKNKSFSKILFNDGKGVISYKITYKKPGKYYYTIREIDDGQRKIRYDESVIKTFVEVVDDDQGALQIKEVKTSSNKTFVNRYRKGIITGDSVQLGIFFLSFAIGIGLLLFVKKRYAKSA